MLGAHEVDCAGGLGRIEGQRCEEREEREDWVFQAIPLPGPIRRMVIGQWYKGDDGPVGVA